MKKIILTSTMLMIGSFIYAQTSKGTISLSATVDFASTSTSSKFGGKSTDGPSNDEISIGVGFGYFVADKVAIGPTVGFVSSKEEQDFTDALGNAVTETSKLSGPDLGAFFRYYFGGNESLSFFGGASVDFRLLSGDQSSSASSTSIDQKLNTLHTGLNGGIVFFPAKKIGIEASIGFLGINNTTSTTGSGSAELENSTDTFNVELFKAPLQFAFVWYLGQK